MPELRTEHTDPEVRRIVDAARDRWMRRLIDRSRLNPLLYYRDLKVGTLDLTDKAELVSRLLAGEAIGIASLALKHSDDDNHDPPDHAQDEVDAREKVRRALVAIQRKALSNREEKGIETLYLSMGMATWPAPDGGRDYDAPVLLLPAQIEMRGRVGHDLRIVVAGEPQLNPVLLYVLAEDHRLRINDVATLRECGAEDETGHWKVAPERVFASIERDAVVVPSFGVKRRAVLANFQFAKLAMVEDMRTNGDAMASSVIVAAIAGHSASRRKLAEAVIDVDAARLDERPASADYFVLDADSTQQRAIVLSCRGQSGIIHGPPGTGKSQTIANLIAQNVAEGRRILFVAEKRAALDAVIKRLSHADVGLGHLLLDLHGASVSRKVIMSRLAIALEQIRHSFPAGSVEVVHREFEARRDQLNAHAHRINVVRSPTGLSVIQMIGQLLKLLPVARSPVRIRGKSLSDLTAQRSGEVRNWLLEASASPTLFLGTDSSFWNNANIADGHRALEALDLAAKAANQLWPAFERLLGEVVHQLGARPPATLNEVASFLGLLSDALRIRGNYSEEIFLARPDELARALEPAARGMAARAWAFLSNGAYRAALTRSIELRSTPAPVMTLLDEVALADDVLKRWRNLDAVSDVPIEVSAASDLRAAFLALIEVTTALGEITWGEPFDDMPLLTTAARLQALASDRQTPHRLVGVQTVRAQLAASGLQPLVDDLRNNDVAPEHWRARFEYVWLISALEHAFASDPALGSFQGRSHDQIVVEFARFDRERIRLAGDRVRRLHAERAIAAMNEHFEQANLVKAEAQKKSRHVPLRELLTRAPDVLTRIAPCWVASPLSVSQLLDGGRQHFDLVIFDEASQVLQEEAIPSLYRAPQVIVAGDKHQLPPTTFFATAIEGEDDAQTDDEESRGAFATATEAIGGYESLLDTLAVFLPPWFLEWHYRSEDERLIAFSNAHIYDGRLVSFPSARVNQVIRHILVSHDMSLGSQEESASREVEEVVRQVLHHAETYPRESLGVITMGIKHANRVQAALDRAIERQPDLADFFSPNRDERVFVKNLETVQGDERDVIILTVGYGKNVNGDLPHRFGPLSQEVGYRRLNVAVTRAKRRMCVISSFSHHEIDLNRSGSRGVQLLKAYLDYASSGGTRLPDTEQAGKVGLNAFEADVRDALEARGIVTRPQFGASRYRIDLVAMHPRMAGRPMLAIECDGATYHSSATARDRDRLRQDHLQRLGWRFHRIWSTDWFHAREEEIERAAAAFEAAVRDADLAETEVEAPESQTQVVPIAVAPASQLVPQRGPRPFVPARENIDQYTDYELRRFAEWVTSDGLLRTREELIRDIFELLPFQRLGGRIRTRIEATVQDISRRQGGSR